MTPALIGEHWLWRAATGPADIAGVGVRALEGDDAARGAVWDYAHEHWRADVLPFEEGHCYLICTQTLYYLGRVKAVTGGFLVLEDASWIHWTGRLSTLLSRYKLTNFPSGHQKPRSERIGEVIVALAGIISAYPWGGPLPQESVT